jgi:hypothetical protein
MGFKKIKLGKINQINVFMGTKIFIQSYKTE